jgi:hypothetical protein
MNPEDPFKGRETPLEKHIMGDFERSRMLSHNDNETVPATNNTIDKDLERMRTIIKRLEKAAREDKKLEEEVKEQDEELQAYIRILKTGGDIELLNQYIKIYEDLHQAFRGYMERIIKL